MGSGEPDDVPTDVAAALRQGTTYIVVLLDEQAVQMLPSTGTVMIGRSRNADIEIKHASVSREHAVLDIDALVLTDLGSRNGTMVAGQRIAAKTPVSIAPGEPIVIGDVTMYVQQDRTSSHNTGSVHDEPLELRLADETARAARHGATFVHARVHLDDAAQADAARELLIEGLRSSDVMSEDAPGMFQLLLPAITADRARPVVQRLVATLEHSGIAARAGVACYPHDGVTAAQLSARARELVAAPGEQSAMDDALRMTASVANSELTVLVTGETGVGKELIAEMIHRISPRSRGPFMRINCAAIPEQLLESELFGHARGAFTGADTARAGLFEAAAGGTLFLDEIGEMSLRTQASLLRVLEERAVRRVGESHARPVDVRIVCATNRPLDDALDGFRRDLYYRISGVTIAIPPLRERPHAIEAIARAFAALASARTRRTPPAFTDEALETLRTSAWPGNVRELRNAIERAVLLAGTGPIRRAELGLDREARPSAPTISPRIDRDTPTEPPPMASTAPADPRALASEIEELERKRIVETLERFGGNQTRAARALGLSRTTLVARMEAYALRRPRKGE